MRLVNETPTASLAAVLEPRLDVTAFLRYTAAQNLVAQEDGFTGYDGMNNFYFYRLEDSPQHVVIAWDEDNAFARQDFGITTRHDENVLMRKIQDHGVARLPLCETTKALGQAPAPGVCP